MFDQEPRLTVDFLLGRVEDPVVGELHEWIVEHQTQLQIAFDGARALLKEAAHHRKVQHDQHVRDAPLVEGQLVLLRNLGSRGRCKTRDMWLSEPYVILQAPSEGGAVYTIALVRDKKLLKRVHHSVVKPLHGEQPVRLALATSHWLYIAVYPMRRHVVGTCCFRCRFNRCKNHFLCRLS